MKTKLFSCKTTTILLTVFFLGFYIQKSNGQTGCAGTDNTVTVCDKELDPSNQTFNLFDQLGGSPVTGGEWIADDRLNINALNSATGIVDLWAITRNGIHTFTYTNSNCNESAVVTLELGGYAGEDNVDGGANACSDDFAVNLFTFLDNDIDDLSADINGDWEADPTASPFLSGYVFNANGVGPGTYHFTYTVDAVSACASRTSRVILEVHEAPNSGVESSFSVCHTDDLSLYTDINLFDYLEGEDINGVWVDVDDTLQLTDSYDTSINIEEIYNNFGSGEYRFTYTVDPTHGVCDLATSTVRIYIEELSGEVSFNPLPPTDAEESFCYSMSSFYINYNASTTLDFFHDIVYEITNTETNQVVFSEVLTEVGPGYNIDPDSPDQFMMAYIPFSPAITEAGSYRITVTEISNVQGVICESLTIADASFIIYAPEAEVTEICYDDDEIIEVEITNLTDETGSLVNGTQALNYTVTHTNFRAYDYTNTGIEDDYVLDGTEIFTETILSNVTFTNGQAIIEIDLSLFSSDLSDGLMNIRFNGSIALGCLSYQFPIVLTPEDIDLSLYVDDDCDATEMEVIVNAPTLTNGEYIVTYDVIDNATSQVLINNTIEIVGGTANYNVDISGLEEGNYTVILRSEQDDIHPCRTQYIFEETDYFSIAGIPEPPVLASATQDFCFSDYEPNGPTIADISVSSGENLTWYASEVSTTPLALTDLLSNGNYYVTAQDLTNTCPESERSVVTVTVYETDVLLGDQTQTFCAIDNPTLEDIDVQTQNGGTVVWFTDIQGTNEIEDTTTTNLVDGTTYFGAENNGGCIGDILGYTVTVVDPPITINNNAFCASPENTIQDLVDSGVVVGVAGTNLVWYDENDIEITDFTQTLTQNTTYSVISVDQVTGCESAKNPIAVYITSPVTSTGNTTYFCVEEDATIEYLELALSISTENGGQVVWYDSLTGGTQLPDNTELEDGTSYFAAERYGSCESTRIEFTPTIIAAPMPVADPIICATRDINSTLMLEEVEDYIQIETGYELIWYDDFSDNAVELDKVNVEVEQLGRYYLAFRHIISGCEGDKIGIRVDITSEVTSTNISPVFCIDDNVTLASLDTTIHNEQTSLVWYDSNDVELLIGTNLVDGGIYYAVESIGDCESETKLEFQVTIVNPIIPETTEETFCFSSGNDISFLENYIENLTALNGASLDLVWYDVPFGGTPLQTTNELTEDTYYVASAYNDNNSFLCESDRVPIEVHIVDKIEEETPFVFCNSDNATLNSLGISATNGGELVWYYSDGTTEVTTLDELLVNGTYYATERNDICESDPTEFTVTVIDTPVPTNTGGDSICVNTGTTIIQLQNNFITSLTASNANYELVWFDENDTEITDLNTELISGNIYKVINRYDDGTVICESESVSILINVTSLIEPPADEELIFCSSDQATLADLAVVAPNNGQLIWFDDEQTNNTIDFETLLVDGTTYYVVEQSGDCEFTTPTAITVTVISPPIPEFTGETELCKLDEPTILTLEEDENMVYDEDYSLIWYDAEEGGSELSTADELEDNTSYYVASVDDETGCESDRIEILISISNCIEEEHDFFIPDGFSPNNDGVNDEYFIPNIEYFYPEYEYEIFNRYGQKLFEGNIDNPNWDGTDQNSARETTSGVYFYILKRNRYDLKPEQGRIYLSK